MSEAVDLIEQLAAAVVVADPADPPAILRLHDSFRAIRSALPAGGSAGASEAAEKAVALLTRLIFLEEARPVVADLRFPVLAVSESSIIVYRDPEHLCTCGEEALTNGYLSRLQLVDSELLNYAVLKAIKARDPQTKDRGVKQMNLGVLADASLGNTAATHKTRACLVEIEFMDVPAVDALFNTGPNAAAMRRETGEAIAAAIVADLESRPKAASA